MGLKPAVRPGGLVMPPDRAFFYRDTSGGSCREAGKWQRQSALCYLFRESAVSSSAAPASRHDTQALDQLTGGAFSAPTAGERAARVRAWLLQEPAAEQMQLYVTI